ncbi:MAG: L-rhamnose isomerase [Promethearchaeota archaeon]
MNEKNNISIEIAQKAYAEFNIDIEKVIEDLNNFHLSIHCWQGDDVSGFEKPESKLTGGGIQVTGQYPGKARNIDELQKDLEKVLSLLPGSHRIDLHAIYGDFQGKFIERNEIEIKHFQNWINWAKDKGIKLDFNPSLFSHPKANTGFTLSDKNKENREFWIEHVKRSRIISNEIGKQLQDPCIHNIWIPDGMKEIPIDRERHRILLKESLDEILSEKYSQNNIKDSLEGKLFGIGSESFVTGSHDFYLSYAIANNIMLTLDTGHFHPTESVADKLSAILPFNNGVVLHISRGIRWDSDHVVIGNDDLNQLCEEIVRSTFKEKIHICTDWFDGSLNRIMGYVIGSRAILKSLMLALLQPWKMLKEFEESGRSAQKLAFLEEFKTLPFGVIWNYYCTKNNVPFGRQWIQEVEKYENLVLNKRINSK